MGFVVSYSDLDFSFSGWFFFVLHIFRNSLFSIETDLSILECQLNVPPSRLLIFKIFFQPPNAYLDPPPPPHLFIKLIRQTKLSVS